MRDIDIVTQHLLGSCVNVDNRVHGLFRIAPAKPAVPRYSEKALSPSEAVAAWDLRAVIAARTS